MQGWPKKPNPKNMPKKKTQKSKKKTPKAGLLGFFYLAPKSFKKTLKPQ